jgi:hypothetical protein
MTLTLELSPEEVEALRVVRSLEFQYSGRALAPEELIRHLIIDAADRGGNHLHALRRSPH